MAARVISDLYQKHVNDEAWGQDGWILAVPIFRDQDEVEVPKNAKKRKKKKRASQLNEFRSSVTQENLQINIESFVVEISHLTALIHKPSSSYKIFRMLDVIRITQLTCNLVFYWRTYVVRHAVVVQSALPSTRTTHSQSQGYVLNDMINKCFVIKWGAKL